MATLLAGGIPAAAQDDARRRELLSACVAADSGKDLDALAAAADGFAGACPTDEGATAWRKAALGLRAARDAIARGHGPDASRALADVPAGDVAPETRKAVLAERDGLRDRISAGLPDRCRGGLKKRGDRAGVLDAVVPLHDIEAHKGSVFGATFSPDGRLLATACEDRRLRLFDVGTGREAVPPIEGHSEAITAVAFSADGRLVASAGGDAIRVWDVGTRREARILPETRCLAFLGNGRIAAAWEKNQAVLWDIASGRESRVFKGHAGSVASVACSPDGKLLATAAADKSIRLWEVSTGKELRRCGEGRSWVGTVAFSGDGKSLATTHGEEKVARVWDVATGRDVRSFAGHADHLWSAVFSPDGRLLATAGADRTARLFEVATGREILSIQGHTMAVASVAFSPDGKLLATAGHDRRVRVWVVPLAEGR